MSKISQLKKENPIYNISLIECLSLLFGKTKYVDLYLKFDKEYKVSNPDFEQEIDEYFRSNELESILHIDNITVYDKYILYKFVSNIFNTDTIKLMNTFIDLNERNLIEQNDITKYKSLDDMINQVSLAQLKTVGKDLERFIIKLRDDEEWLILKPLSWEASKKYGSNTKWCTTSSDNNEYFYKYSRRGVLIYTINKKTGYKVALYKEMGESISFWDQRDNRIDSLETLLPDDIKSFLFGYCTSNDVKPNHQYLNEEEKLEIEKTIETVRLHSLRIIPTDEVLEEAMEEVEQPMGEIETQQTFVIPIATQLPQGIQESGNEIVDRLISGLVEAVRPTEEMTIGAGLTGIGTRITNVTTTTTAVYDPNIWVNIHHP